VPYYLVQASYTERYWDVLIKNPQNRVEALRPVIESLGGKIENAFLAFGDYDVVAILQMPENVNAAALSMALMAGGAVNKVKTTPLVTWEEGVEAMKKAHKAAYQPPKSSPMLLRSE